MKKLISIFSFVIISFGFFSQSFFVGDNLVSIEGDASNESIANNTFLNATASDVLQWTIVDASIPQEWEFSNCFPNCYDIGVTSGTLEIIEGESYYLNCHVYPNNTPGEGSITMQIISGDGTTELVSWQAIAGSASLIENESSYVAVYPNPTYNSFTLSTKDVINMNFMLVDIQGKVVLTGKIESTEETVDISNLSRGQYNLVFEDESIPVVSVIKQ